MSTGVLLSAGDSSFDKQIAESWLRDPVSCELEVGLFSEVDLLPNGIKNYM